MNDGKATSGISVNKSSSSTSAARYVPPHLRSVNNNQQDSQEPERNREFEPEQDRNYKSDQRDYRSDRDPNPRNSNSDFRG